MYVPGGGGQKKIPACPPGAVISCVCHHVCFFSFSWVLEIELRSWFLHRKHITHDAISMAPHHALCKTVLPMHCFVTYTDHLKNTTSISSRYWYISLLGKQSFPDPNFLLQSCILSLAAILLVILLERKGLVSSINFANVLNWIRVLCLLFQVRWFFFSFFFFPTWERFIVGEGDKRGYNGKEREEGEFFFFFYLHSDTLPRHWELASLVYRSRS